MSDFYRVIFDFNKMLRGGGMKRVDCYRWLERKRLEEEDEFERVHGFKTDLSHKYLSPEIAGPMPESYEDWEA